MAWRRPGDKPLSELMMVSLLTHICVTRPQWVKWVGYIVRHWERHIMQWYYCFPERLLLDISNLCINHNAATIKEGGHGGNDNVIGEIDNGEGMERMKRARKRINQRDAGCTCIINCVLCPGDMISITFIDVFLVNLHKWSLISPIVLTYIRH